MEGNLVIVQEGLCSSHLPSVFSATRFISRLIKWTFQIKAAYCETHTRHTLILWHMDPLLGKDLETNGYSHCYAIGEKTNGRF
jgi:hypothetical protein